MSTNIKKSEIHLLAIKLLILLTLFLITAHPAKAYYNETTIKNFTNSISSVYSASKACKKTIAPGPEEYISLISDYLLKLYPNGTAYWVIPDTVALISDPSTCIRLIQETLINYRNAQIKYRNTHPSRMPAPILVAYNWENGYYAPSQEEPVKSYTPSIKINIKKSVTEKFANSNLQ